MPLRQYYEVNFALMQHHKYSLRDIDSMYPFERDIYVNMLEKYLKELKDKHDSKRK